MFPELSNDVERLIVANLDPRSFAAYAQVCRGAHALVQEVTASMIAIQLQQSRRIKGMLNAAKIGYGEFLGDACCMAQYLRNHGIILALGQTPVGTDVNTATTGFLNFLRGNIFSVKARRQFKRIIATLAPTRSTLPPERLRLLANAYWNLGDMNFTEEGMADVSLLQHAATFISSGVGTDYISQALAIYEGDIAYANSMYKAGAIYNRYMHQSIVGFRSNAWRLNSCKYYRAAALLGGHEEAAMLYIVLLQRGDFEMKCLNDPTTGEQFAQDIMTFAAAGCRKEVLTASWFVLRNKPYFINLEQRLQQQ